MKPELQKSLYRDMLRIRMVEEKIAELYPEQEMRCPVHLSIGQEAVAVGVCSALAPDDYMMSAHRSHAHYLAKGGDLKAMISELYGRVTGCCKGRGGSMHLFDLDCGFLGAVPIVGSTIPIAVGAAFGSVLKGESQVMAVFFGEGATEEGVFHEALNFAALKKLPVVFVCENNLFSVYSPLSVRQPEGNEVFLMGKAHDIDSYQGDGNDVDEVYSMTQKAVAKAREGGGPTLLEFKTYRWREHCGPYYDNDLGYRAVEEFEKWKKLCPVKRLSETMLGANSISQQDLLTLEQSLSEEIMDVFSYAKQSPYPEKQSLLENIYA